MRRLISEGQGQWQCACSQAGASWAGLERPCLRAEGLGASSTWHSGSADSLDAAVAVPRVALLAPALAARVLTGGAQDDSRLVRRARMAGWQPAAVAVLRSQGPGREPRWRLSCHRRRWQPCHTFLVYLRQCSVRIRQVERPVRRDLHGQVRSMHQEYKQHHHQGRHAFQPRQLRVGVLCGALAGAFTACLAPLARFHLAQNRAHASVS